MMTIQGKTFDTLTAYLEWLKQQWCTFEDPLYTLIDYLEYGKFMWTEVYCLRED
jgi:hypothetical protein